MPADPAPPRFPVPDVTARRPAADPFIPAGQGDLTGLPCPADLTGLPVPG